MPAVAPYIPAKDASLNAWLANFSALLTANPYTYAQTPAVAATVATVVAAWTAAYALVTSPTTKTKATVAAKNTEKVLVLANVRPIAQQISLSPGVTSANKTAIGVNPRTSTPAPIAAPTTYPVLSITSAHNLSVVLAYRDQMSSPSVKAKPYGVVQVQLYATEGAAPITDPTLLAFTQAATKSPFQVVWPSGTAGKIASYAARYITKAGRLGPWSPIVTQAIAG